MQSAPLRDDEAQSLAALRALEVLDTCPEVEFDALVRAASIVCGVPVSLISLIDAERQWFKANIGLPGVHETPRDLAFCAHAVLGDELFEVPDAALDPRFADNPLVISRPDIRFYAGAPVRLLDGSRVGTLCVIDRQPRSLNETQRQVLMELAAAAAQALEGRRALRAIQQVSREMAQSEARFRLLSETVPIGVFEIDTQGEFSYANERLLDILGLQRGQTLAWSQLVHADDRESVAEQWRDALSKQSGMEAEFRIRLADGSVKQLQTKARLRISESGQPGGYVGTVEDVTESRRQEDALRTSQAFLDRTGRLAGVGGWEVDLAKQRLFWSAETCRIHGLEAGHQPSLEEALAFYTPQARPLIEQAVQRALATGEGFDLELQQQLRDGRKIWVQAVGSVEFNGTQAARLVGAFQDVTERVNERLALKEAHSLMQLATDSGGIGIWDCDLVQGRLKWDTWMYRLYGLDGSEQLASYDFWASHLHPEDRAAAELSLQEAIEGLRPFATEFRIIWADGSVHHIRGSALIMRDAAGQALRMVGVNWDTTEHHRIEAELREAKLVAEAANKAKSEFLANMSHEIRTPMNAILGMLTLLRKTQMSERQADYTSKTEGAARALLGLLNEILDFSKVEAGKMELDPQAMRVDDLLRDLSVILSANVGAKNLALVFDIDPALPRVLVGDAMRLQQVLINLTGNAIKFTEQGKVVLAIKVLQLGQASVHVHFAVTDTGIGIAPENQARIFSGFTQAEASTTRRFGGTGLGVAISQRLVALMGGELTLHSELGRGSCFEFSLTMPFAQDEDDRDGDGYADTVFTPAPATTFIEPPRLVGMRLLLVEDNLNNQQVAAELLREEGANVQIAGDGQQAIAAIAADPSAFDLVLMDLQMPVMDGFAATRHLREVLGLRALPIVAMTANAMSSDREACLAAGMNDHIGKPFDLDQLVRVLRQHGGGAGPGRSGGKGGPGHPDQRPASSSSLKRPLEISAELSRAATAAAVNLAAALQRMGGKPAVYCRMLRNFTADLPSMQTQLRGYLNEGDAESAARLVHTLKGVAATLGADQLAAQAGLAERALMDALAASKANSSAHAFAPAGVATSVLQDYVEISCVAMASALPGLTELLRVMQASESSAPLGSSLGSLAQMPADELQGLLKALDDLLHRLQDSDMEALHVMSVLQSRYASVLGNRLQGLDEALGRLEFESAIASCKALLSEAQGAQGAQGVQEVQGA